MGCILSTNRSRPETRQIDQANELALSQDSGRFQPDRFADCYSHAMELAQQFSDTPLPVDSQARLLQDQAVEICTELAQRFHSQQGYSPAHYLNRLQTLQQELVLARQDGAAGSSQRRASPRHQVGVASVRCDQ